MMKVSQITHKEYRKIKQNCMEKVLWQELIGLQKFQEKHSNFRHARYCTLKKKKEHLENHLKFL